jgi:hypothetical protein
MRKLTITATALAALLSLGALHGASAEPYVPRSAPTSPAIPGTHDPNHRVLVDPVHGPTTPTPVAHRDAQDQRARREAKSDEAETSPREHAARTAAAKSAERAHETTKSRSQVPARVAPRKQLPPGRPVVHSGSRDHDQRSNERGQR